MDTINDRPSLMIIAPKDVESVQASMRSSIVHEEDLEEGEEQQYSGLFSYIKSVFEDNKNVRQSSGIEEKMLQSLRAYNGNYDPEDLAKINSTGGSDIYMNLTPTKCRAAMSWIRDIMMPAKETAWGFEPTSKPDLPPEIIAQIEEYINQLTVEQSASVGAPSGTGEPQKPTAQDAAQRLQEISQLKRDVEDALTDEIYKVASGEVKKFERIVADQLQEGDWDKALSEFIEDFCVFQIAVMKGPIITKKKRLTYVNGLAEETSDFIFLNKRVSPFDIYPSADATGVNDGNLCEHVRFDKKSLYNMIGVKHYKDENIRKVLADFKDGYNDITSTIDSERVEEEFRGDTYRANKGLIHGIHFFGSVPYNLLLDWGFEKEKIGEDEDKIFEVEAIVAGNEVIKCVLNDDPLLRRPYYKASFQNIPGSWWGRSLPELMRDIQRMCNATARALANNMGIASGPQIEVYTDRLADDVELEAIKPFHIWQLTSDPSGAGGRAVQFWQPTSNAQELLAVYKEFEIRADDATGIPRYAYGNERSLADYEEVWTPTGSVPISELQIGDTVCNTYGGNSSVLGVYPQGICDIFRVSFSNNTHIDCTMDHLWEVATNDIFSTKSLEEILGEGIFRKDGDKYRPKFKIPSILSLELQEQEVPVDPYTLGAWLGDGCKGTGIISGIDNEVFDNIPYEVTHRFDKIHHNCIGLITDLKKTDVWDKGCFEKFIPKEYLFNSEQVRLELLRGLMDTDGCCAENGRLIYTTSSEQLRDDFIQLVKSLGGTTQGYTVNNKEGYKPSFKITFQYNRLDIPIFKIERKEERRVAKTRYVNIYISGVEYVGSNTATCIKVDSKDHLYVCKNFIPTHNTGGAAQTASGLSMLLESAAKGIKDSVRNIDYGLIKPRVEYQFYYNIISNDDIDFTGDVNVVPRGSEILTMKGASEMRRNEFIQILANPNFIEIVGMEGIADVLREMAKSLGLGHNIVPSRLELKKKQEEAKAAQQQQMQMQQEEQATKSQTSLQATQMQVQGQDAMNQRSLQLKAEEIKVNIDQKEKDRQLRVIEMQQSREDSVNKLTSSLQKQQMIEANKNLAIDKQIALSLKSGDKVNTQ